MPESSRRKSVDNLSTNKFNFDQLDINFAKKNSLCMLPWISMHVMPNNLITPCCIAGMEYSEEIKSTNDSNLMDYVNSPFMNKLRLSMIHGRRHKICNTCYMQEENGDSFRKSANRENEEFFQEAMDITRDDGSLDPDAYKMRYVDIRFSNVCNMKCRTCNSGFSTLWAHEDKKFDVGTNEFKNDINKKTLLSDTLKQLAHAKKVYFAGGEPLVTEEHYSMLEELIRLGRKDVALAYNTNLSNLKFKNRDLVKLWNYFDHPIQLYASLDHYGERAEYIRSGTIWEEVLENYRTVYNTKGVDVCITTSVSAFNYLTLPSFFEYLMDLDLFPLSTDGVTNRGTWQLNPVYFPEPLSVNVLPRAIKDIARKTHHEFLDSFYKKHKGIGMVNGYGDDLLPIINAFRDFHRIAESKDAWDINRSAFFAEVDRIDRRRGESFFDVFPELLDLKDI